ncbi:MAG: hypothetical protein FVQ77_15280 [Cytophagales bacterium]|nr:hypothetical protein [Cytophagales bacterium]
MWKEYKLADIMDLIGGGTPKTTIAEYWNGDLPWLSVGDFNNGRKKVYETEKTLFTDPKNVAIFHLHFASNNKTATRKRQGEN